MLKDPKLGETIFIDDFSISTMEQHYAIIKSIKLHGCWVETKAGGNIFLKSEQMMRCKTIESKRKNWKN